MARRKNGTQRIKLAFCAFFLATFAGISVFCLFVHLVVIPVPVLDEKSSERKHLRIQMESQNNEVIESNSNIDVIRNRQYYWKSTINGDTGLQRLPTGLKNSKYILFEDDCGGFNNIRMAFEYFYIMAYITQRTLVMPPPSPWYLIDFGPFVRMKPKDKSKYLTSKYGEFFDLEHLRSGVPILTFDEFLKLEGDNLKLPSEILSTHFDSRKERKKFDNFIRTETEILKHLLWGPLQKIVFFPSIAEVEAKFKVPPTFVHHREIVEITGELNAFPILAFPSCMNNADARYLGQVAAIVAFADEAQSRSYKRLLRDTVHYKKVVFDLASLLIQRISKDHADDKLFNFVGLHVRRNELQYKEVFMEASSLYSNIQPLVKESEVFYIATDEKDARFFKFIENKGHKVLKWKDFTFITDSEQWKNTPSIRKLEGCIEQVVCANARIFMGTLESTFTSYIFRLRGYLHAPSTEVYFHTLKYTGNVEADRAITYSKKPPRGQIYKSEHPSIWEDAEADFTSW